MKHFICIIIMLCIISAYYYHSFIGDNLNKLTTHIPGDLQDPLYLVCLYQWHYQQINNGFDGYWNVPWHYPYERVLTYSEHCFFLGLLAYPIIAISQNPVLANNIIHFLGILFTAIAVYYTAYILTDSCIVSICCGLFALFPAQVQSYRVHLYSFPLVFIFIYQFMKSEKIKYLILASLFFVIGFLTSNHIGAYLVIFTPIWGIAYLVYYKRFNKKIVITIMTSVIIVAGILYPFIVPYIETSQEMGFRKIPEHLKYYRPDVTSYVASNAGNVFYKQGLNKIGLHDTWIRLSKSRFKLFPGFALLILSGIGFIQRYRFITFYQKVLLVTCILAFIFSFGAYFNIMGEWIPNYSYLIPYYLIPGLGRIRITVRVMMVFYIALSLLAGFGIKRLVTYNCRLLVYPLIVLLMGFFLIENYVTPPNYSRVPEIPNNSEHIVIRIKALPVDSVIIHYPFTNNMKYQYWSLYHHKRIVNGYASFAPPLYRIVRTMMNTYPDEKVIRWLQALGVTHIIVNESEIKSIIN